MKKNLYMKHNIKFYPNRVRYVTHSIFDYYGKQIIKVPSYIIDDVIQNNKQLHVFYSNHLKQEIPVGFYSAQALKYFIAKKENTEFDGVLHKNPIKYNLYQIFTRNGKSKIFPDKRRLQYQDQERDETTSTLGI